MTASNHFRFKFTVISLAEVSKNPPKDEWNGMKSLQKGAKPEGEWVLLFLEVGSKEAVTFVYRQSHKELTLESLTDQRDKANNHHGIDDFQDGP
jgi:hypothetical protein